MKNLNQNSAAAPRLTIHYFVNSLKINKLGGGALPQHLINLMPYVG